MSDEQIERAIECRSTYDANCEYCPNTELGCANNFSKELCDYVMSLKLAKQLAETQLKELLSALYRQTSEEKRGDYTAHKGFTLYRKDIIELVKDYGIKEEELK